MSEALARRARNNADLAARGVKTAELFAAPILAETEFRTAEEVARRALVLVGIVSASHGVDLDEIVVWLGESGLIDELSPQERTFLAEPEAFDDLLYPMQWRFEALIYLLWALGKAELPWPDMQSDASLFAEMPPRPGESTAAFLSAAKLRPAEELLDRADWVRRLNWAAREHRYNGAADPGAIAGIVQEWHHAANWTICWPSRAECAWDDVDTPT